MEYLGVDEFFLHKGHKCATLIMDLKSGNVLYLAYGKKKQTVYDFIDWVSIDWIRRKATFKSNTTDENMAGFMVIDSGTEKTAYMPLNGFTTVDIGCERGNNSYNMVNSLETPFAAQYLQVFDSLWNDKEKLQDVTAVVLENITTAYNENSPELIYFITLYNVFSEFLEDVSEDVLPNEATGF